MAITEKTANEMSGVFTDRRRDTFITAKRAREITDAVNNKGSVAVYDDIQSVLGTGIDHIYTEYPISEVTRKNLTEKGYKVDDMPQIAIQKDGLYHKVSW